MKDTEALVTLEPVEVIEKIVDIPALLEEWKDVPELEADIGTKDERYKRVKAGNLQFVSARNKVEAGRKRVKAPALEHCRKVDAAARKYKDMMADTEDRLFIQRHKVEAYEAEQKQKILDAEKKRVEAISEAIREIMDAPGHAIGRNAQSLMDTYNSIPIPVEEIFQERLNEAMTIYTEAMRKLEDMIETAKKAEAADKLIADEQARLAREQAIKDKQAAKEREEFEAEKRKLQEEKDAFNRQKTLEEEERRKKLAEAEAEEYEKQQKIEAEEHEKQQKIEAEELAREQEEQAKKTENESREQYEKKFNEIVSFFSEMKNFTPENITASIVVGDVPNVRFE